MSSSKVAVTIFKSPDEVRRLWSQHDDGDSPGEVTFTEAPGDRGTEIHVEIPDDARGGKIGEAVGKLTGSDPRAKALDKLRRFKALVETGEVPRSEGSPEGELAERKLKQRPAQPLDESELEKVGV